MTDPIRLQPGAPAQNADRVYPAQQGTVGSASKGEQENFSELLENLQGLRFSTHAQKRLETRQIQLTDESLERLAGAVEKVEKRGGKESLVLVDDMAFIVNVKDRLVITAMDSESRGEGVFTKIDSVVIAEAPAVRAGQAAAAYRSSQNDQTGV